jgi:hypothetical protein
VALPNARPAARQVTIPTASITGAPGSYSLSGPVDITNNGADTLSLDQVIVYIRTKAGQQQLTIDSTSCETGAVAPGASTTCLFRTILPSAGALADPQAFSDASALVETITAGDCPTSYPTPILKPEPLPLRCADLQSSVQAKVINDPANPKNAKLTGELTLTNLGPGAGSVSPVSVSLLDKNGVPILKAPALCAGAQLAAAGKVKCTFETVLPSSGKLADPRFWTAVAPTASVGGQSCTGPRGPVVNAFRPRPPAPVASPPRVASAQQGQPTPKGSIQSLSVPQCLTTGAASLLSLGFNPLNLGACTKGASASSWTGSKNPDGTWTLKNGKGICLTT